MHNTPENVCTGIPKMHRNSENAWESQKNCINKEREKKNIYRISLNNVLPYIMSSLEYYPPFFPKYSHNQYITFENLQIVSPSEDVKIIDVLGHYLRKYGK